MIRKPEVFLLSCGHKKSSGYHSCDEIERELFLVERATAGGILLLIQNKESAFC